MLHHIAACDEFHLNKGLAAAKITCVHFSLLLSCRQQQHACETEAKHFKHRVELLQGRASRGLATRKARARDDLTTEFFLCCLFVPTAYGSGIHFFLTLCIVFLTGGPFFKPRLLLLFTS